MPMFDYKARDSLGEEVNGQIDTNSVAVAKQSLFERGLFPVKVEEAKSNAPLKGIFSFQKKIQGRDLANLTRQFEVMFSAGMKIDKTLEILANQSSHEGLKYALKSIQADVATGTRLSLAFEKHPEYFNSLYVNMIEMGQSGGILDKTLKEMSKILVKEHEIHTKVKGAMLYPKIVIFALIGVFWAMLAFVFPSFSDFYAGYGAELPLPTQIMINLSTVATTYWYIPVTIFGGGYYWWLAFTKTDVGKEFKGRLAFALPVFGNLNKLVANARFGHLTAALYRAGVSLPQSLAVVAGTVNNVCFSTEVKKLKEGLEQGKSLSSCMKDTSYFSPMITEACSVGEQTGRLDVVLDATADFYDEEVNDMVNNLTTLIEPIMMFFLFGAVLLLALAVYMPIWNMSKTVLT